MHLTIYTAKFQKTIALAILAFALGAAVERKLGLTMRVQNLLPPEPQLPALGLAAPRDTDRLLAIEPPFPDSTQDKTAWDDWQRTIRGALLSLGGSPVVARDDEQVRYRILSERILTDGVTQQLIAFESFDESEIPAYLHLPDAAKPAPGILVIPGHVREYESGIEQVANDFDSYQHAAARELAAQGYITLAPELRGFGYLGTPLGTEHRLIAYNAIASGSSYKWISLRDVGRAMALLRQHSAIDSNRIGVTGASLGGELAVQYSALDPDVDAVAFHAFGGGTGVRGPIYGSRADQPHYCHVLPRIDRVIPLEYWFWLLAPRPVLGVRGVDDHPFDDADRKTYSRPWKVGEATPKLALVTAEGGHEFFVAQTTEFFDRTLKPRIR